MTAKKIRCDELGRFEGIPPLLAERMEPVSAPTLRPDPGQVASAPQPQSVLYRIGIVLAIVAVAYLLPGLAKPPTLFDEGLVNVAGLRVARGEVPYRDFWSLYAPGQFYTLALLFDLFGATLLTARVWDIAIQAALVVAVFRVTRQFVSGIKTLAAPVLVLIWLGSVAFPNYPIYPALLFSLLAVQAVCWHISDGRRRWLFMAGICVGLTTVYRHDIGIYAAASTALVTVLSPLGWTRIRSDGLRGPCREAALNLGMLLTAVAIPTVPIFTDLLLKVPPDQLWAQLFVYPVQIAPLVRGQPNPPLLLNPWAVLQGKPGESITLVVQWIRFYAPVAIYVGMIAVGACMLARYRTVTVDRTVFWGTVLLWCFGLALLGQTRIIKDWAHEIPTSIIAVILLNAVLPRFFAVRRSAWLHRLAFMLFLVATIPYIQGPMIYWAVRSRPLWTGPCPWTIDTSGCAEISTELYDAVRYIREHVAPDRAIFVGSRRNDQTIGNPILFYFLADRPSATKYHQFEPGVATTPPVQAEIIGELKRRDVTHLVLYSGFDELYATIPVGSPLLDHYIHTNYRLAAQFGTYAIWERT
ncbi:MAG: glycosyltransferase family 39 protein [Chloroflexi bacterium]|nr:glycosyltransferase family 39 protein [Chloroflexota bacterium]